MEQYLGKDFVENVFQTMKGELSLEPIRYRRQDCVVSDATVV